MADSRVIQLAEYLIFDAVNLKEGENILIETTDTPDFFSVELIKAVERIGGNALVSNFSSRVRRQLFKSASARQMEIETENTLEKMKNVQAYIDVRGIDNTCEYEDVDENKMFLYRKIAKKVRDYRTNNLKWCVLRWPSSSMAQSAGMSTDAFESFYFSACLVDYKKMEFAAVKLVKLMAKTNMVRLVAKDTDVMFSIKNIPIVSCCGHENVPDGEVYTAPVRESVNGVIHYNTPTLYNGRRFSGIRLVFKDGRIIEASCETGDNAQLNAIFDSDEGARYVGEFAIGFNPVINNPMCDILFDEKISGSIHFTPGACYDNAFNGNHSAVHWDLVLIMRPEYGGGEIWFDDKLVRKDGLFLLDELKCLNPDKLMGD